MKEYQWEVEILSPPPAVRYCKKCGCKTEYACADLFRVNAQRKYLDIWLIYKCAQCDSTWNMTIYARVNPQDLPKEQLEGFHKNSRELAQKYAMDTGLLRRNGASPGQPRFRVLGDALAPGTLSQVRITGAYASGLRIASVVREKLGLSGKAFKQLVLSGSIQGPAGCYLEKCRWQEEIVLLINTGAEGFPAPSKPTASLPSCSAGQEK